MFTRYGRPIIIAETSHPGEDRGKWIRSITKECVSILKSEIPLFGCCYYPIIDRPDWDDTEDWHHSGIWDIFETDSLQRIPDEESLVAVKEFNLKINSLTYLKV